tara:strand:- start:1068 stop:1994 length:927 start_codon:yes stop_codon:yes gene_type:complete
MKNYFVKKSALSVPWVESPFFHSLLESSTLNEKEKKQCQKFNKDGYLIIDLDLRQDKIDKIISDMKKSLTEEETIFHADHFQYTESKRIFQLWKKSESCAKLTANKNILKTLNMLYGREAFPFSTINFFKGTNQPLHSDAIHFHSIPQLWMVGVWVALEDTSVKNGTLKIVPGSHKWKIWDYEAINLPHPDTIKDGEKENYREYENFLVQLVKEKNIEAISPDIKKGQALIWSANLLHGGCNVEGITDFALSRYSQVQHYFFKDCKIYYHPMFSRVSEGKYAKKWCDENNNILTHLTDMVQKNENSFK